MTDRDDEKKRPDAREGSGQDQNTSPGHNRVKRPFAPRRQSRDDDRPGRDAGFSGRSPDRFSDRSSDREPGRRRPEQREGSSSSGPEGSARALVHLDQDIMKLLVRRATLVSRIREGRDHAASAAAVQAEKTVRTAWERNARAFSNDPRFARNLFDMLQGLKILSKTEAESKGRFVLHPPAKPVSLTLSGPADSRVAAMWMALSAALNVASALSPVPLSQTLTDTVKALNQAGATISFEAPGRVSCQANEKFKSGPSLGGKNIFVGDSPLALYLMAFLGVESPGACRFSGGNILKMADLSGLRHTLPLLGARLAHVVPRSQGLPVTVEYSGELHDHIAVPEDLPVEGVCALLTAALAWRRTVSIDLGELPGHVAATALAEAFVLYELAGADVDSRGSSVCFSGRPETLPPSAPLPLDAETAAYLLALPAFTGGAVTLNGVWPKLPMAHDVAAMLAHAGLEFTISPESVTARAGEKSFPGIPAPDHVSESLHPLFWALSALAARLSQEDLSISSPPLGADMNLAGDFLSLLNLALLGDDAPRLRKAMFEDKDPTWVSPDRFWGLALCLASFLRPGLALANPDIITAGLPYYWTLFNSLPEPQDFALIAKPKKEEAADEKPARRRIIAD